MNKILNTLKTEFANEIELMLNEIAVDQLIALASDASFDHYSKLWTNAYLSFIVPEYNNPQSLGRDLVRFIARCALRNNDKFNAFDKIKRIEHLMLLAQKEG